MARRRRICAVRTQKVQNAVAKYIGRVKLNGKFYGIDGKEDMKPLNSAELAALLGYGGKVAAAEISEVSTDSRKTDGQTLFVALKGEKFDGHDFIGEVLAKGAPLAVAEHPVSGVAPDRVIIVDSTLKALGKLGQYNRRQFKGTVIALTGSSGKTTTKEELKAVLSRFAPTYATSGNFNNQIGVPRSLLDIDMNARYAVIEMGMSARGEIDYLTRLAEPDVAVVTNVYPMHIEYLGTLENIARAKAEIFSGLRPGGIAVYNEDTAFADILREEAQKHAAKIVPFGKNKHPDVALALQDDGEHCYYNAWCVLTVAQLLGLDLNTAAAVANAFMPPEGRGKKYRLNIGGRKVILVDDSYSGQPEAVKLALRALAKMPVRGKRIAVLGKMAELGDYSRQAHIEVGREMAAAGIDAAVGVCEETKDILAQLPAGTAQYYFPDNKGVADFLMRELLQDGDAVLVKGAHYSSRVFEIADALKQYAEMA